VESGWRRPSGLSRKTLTCSSADDGRGNEKAVAEIGKNITAIQGDVSNLADLDQLFQTVEKSKKARSTFYSRMRALSNRRRRRPSLLNTMTKHSTSIRGERSSRSRKHCR